MQKLIGLLATALCLAIASASSFAVAVTTENESDSHAGVFLFNSLANAVAVDDGTLVSRVNLGLNAFEAVATSQTSPGDAFDTTSLDIVAPDGYVITGIQFVEELEFEVNNGIIIANGSLEVGDVTSNLGDTLIVNTFLDLGMMSGSFDSGFIALDNLASIDVSVTNSLTAVEFGVDSVAEIFKTAAYFDVTLAEAAPVPLPPAAWLLGSAVLGLLTVRRNKNNA